MSIRTWLINRLKKDNRQTTSIPIHRIETPDKIIETKIRPVKVPTAFDISERLAYLSRDILILKDQMVTKFWFRNEFDDVTPAMTEKLDRISDDLRSLQNNFTNLTSVLSNLTKDDLASKVPDIDYFGMSFNTPDIIMNIVKTNKAIRYKDIKKQLPVSDPTLSKYLKNLVSDKKINRIKVGKAVFYEAI